VRIRMSGPFRGGGDHATLQRHECEKQGALRAVHGDADERAAIAPASGEDEAVRQGGSMTYGTSRWSTAQSAPSATATGA
jgi:hypothetical protein